MTGTENKKSEKKAARMFIAEMENSESWGGKREAQLSRIFDGLKSDDYFLIAVTGKRQIMHKTTSFFDEEEKKCKLNGQNNLHIQGVSDLNDTDYAGYITGAINEHADKNTFVFFLRMEPVLKAVKKFRKKDNALPLLEGFTLLSADTFNKANAQSVTLKKKRQDQKDREKKKKEKEAQGKNQDLRKSRDRAPDAETQSDDAVIDDESLNMMEENFRNHVSRLNDSDEQPPDDPEIPEDLPDKKSEKPQRKITDEEQKSMPGSHKKPRVQSNSRSFLNKSSKSDGQNSDSLHVQNSDRNKKPETYSSSKTSSAAASQNKSGGAQKNGKAKTDAASEDSRTLKETEDDIFKDFDKGPASAGIIVEYSPLDDAKGEVMDRLFERIGANIDFLMKPDKTISRSQLAEFVTLIIRSRGYDDFIKSWEAAEPSIKINGNEQAYIFIKGAADYIMEVSHVLYDKDRWISFDPK